MHRPIARCTSCRFSILDAFTSLAGISMPVVQATPPQLRRPQISPVRRFSRFAPLRQSPASSQIEESPSEASPPPSSTIPWYLQVEEPVPPAPISPILALQEIPPLPPNPPRILSPILEHLSVQIGLDDLVLLDLRNLDPPPALGANLLMIIGTARSVKHLNVSADRFCRWVRREYKLRPYADGLLGRNELKLKLRRKARRLKLAQSVGNTVAMQSGADDGITTGWVCVNMGPVDEAALPLPEENDVAADVTTDDAAAEVQSSSTAVAGGHPYDSRDEPAADEEEYDNPAEEDTYVGFGSRTDAPRIVVQMFIEDKRAEMDLEGLWDVRNTRRARREERANAQALAAVEEIQIQQQGQDQVGGPRE